MKKPFVLIPLMLILVVLIVSGCTPNANTVQPKETSTPVVTNTVNETAAPVATPKETSTPAATAAADSAELVLTPDELAQYNGQDGMPAYIAVDGVIYDVTNVPQWNGGAHNGFTAGQDLTEEIKNISPHGVSKLKLVNAVGKLTD